MSAATVGLVCALLDSDGPPGGCCSTVTISLTIILLETTNDIQYLLPVS